MDPVQIQQGAGLQLPAHVGFIHATHQQWEAEADPRVLPETTEARRRGRRSEAVSIKPDKLRLGDRLLA